MLGGPHQVVEGTDVVTNDADTATIGRLAGAVAEAYGAGAGEQMDWRHVICGLRCVCVCVCLRWWGAVQLLTPASPLCPFALPLPPRLPPRCYTCAVLCSLPQDGDKPSEHTSATREVVLYNVCGSRESSASHDASPSSPSGDRAV